MWETGDLKYQTPLVQWNQQKTISEAAVLLVLKCSGFSAVFILHRLFIKVLFIFNANTAAGIELGSMTLMGPPQFKICDSIISRIVISLYWLFLFL